MLGTAPRGARRIPLLTATLFAANLGFFAATWAAGGTEEPAVLALYGAKVVPLIEAGEYWRVVSSAFLHIGPVHLLLNLYALYLLGAFVERAYGIRRALAIYTAGAAAGGCASTLLSPTLSAGASGAIFGLLGVTLLFGFRNRRRLSPESQRMFWSWLLPFFILSIVLSFLSNIIDNWAHLGGLVGGVLAALPWGNPAERKPLGAAASAAATAAAVAAGALVVASLGFAVRSAASDGIWTEAELRTVEDPATGIRFRVPLHWKELTPEDSTTDFVFTDRLGGAVNVQVRPYVTTLADLEALVQSEVRGMRSAKEGGGLVVAPGRTRLAGADAVRVVFDVREERVTIRRELYFVAAKGRSVILSLDARQNVERLYRPVFAAIQGSLVLRDDTPLVQGWALLGAGKAREALAPLERAASGPRPLLALRALVRAHQALGDGARALHWAGRALRLAPADAQARIDFIEALQAAGRKDDAARFLAEARRQAASDPRTLFSLAQVAMQQERWAEAIAIYEEVITIRRDLYTAYNNLAWLLATATDRSLRNPDRAVKLAKVAVEGRAWKEPAFIDTLAEALYASGRAAEAAATEEKAVALEPQNEIYRKQLEKFRRSAGGRRDGGK
jgi:membrane associated rhomboid family serine protease/tetratricopeptide (TPR) repeat protein